MKELNYPMKIKIETSFMITKIKFNSFVLRMKLEMLRLFTSREMFFALFMIVSRSEKIRAIKTLQKVTGLDLREAKELTDKMDALLWEFRQEVK
jgi:ribosomal protein L7/L12